AKNELEYELAVTQLIGEVCDTHAGLWGGGDKIDSLKGDEQAPVQVQFIENKWVITDYYINAYPHFSNAEKVKETGLKIGDIITHIGGKPVEAIVDSIKKYYPASNEAARMRNIANDLLRSDQSVVYINYLSSNQPKQKRLLLTKRNNLYPYYTPKDTTTQCYKFISKDIGYITLKSIKDEDIPAIKETFKNTKGIIIDIRNYPSAFTPFTLAPYFVSKSTPFVKFTNGNVNNPGEFTFTSPLKIPKPKETYQGKLVVIVNENTQSSAEYQSMAFRVGNNTTIIGSQTAGADGNVSEIFLPGGLKTWISGIGVYYPDGRETQRIGIVPDIEVKPTIKGIREGRDEVLEKAIEIINNDK
ncbi:MAG: S41 family peptidase, partial [Candidatus Azobacteroides sp.]|nr:S41 family peptidase [Candidatus Azobacteroides sp.]